jgi:hypothetical protein
MNDYGFRPGGLNKLDPEEGYFPNSTDVYNPNMPHNGNTNWGKESFRSTLPWMKTTFGKIDARLFYTERAATDWTKCRWTDGAIDEGPRWYRYSTFTGS